MRVSDSMTYDQVRGNLSKNRQEMAELQNQAATQKRVTKPSDDPVAASRVLSSRVELQGTEQYLKNLDYARSFLEFTDQSLSELTEYLVRVKELALSQANDASSNDGSRRVIAAEVDQIYAQMVQVGNRKLGERFIFGGYSTTKSPFDYQGGYQGDNGEMLIHVDKGSFVSMNIPGSKVFLGEGLSGDKISHVTTQQAETLAELEQQLAQEEQQQLLKQQKIQQDKTQNEMQKQQEESLPVRGLASDESTDKSSEIQNQTGRPQGINLFDAVKKIKIALSAGDKNSIQDNLEVVDEAISQVILTRAQVGARVMALGNMTQTLQKGNVDSQIAISSLEDVDAFKVISDINKTESTLQATLQTSGKLMQPSLMEFLR